MILELPIVYARNYKEVEEAVKGGLPEPEIIESIDKTFLIIPNKCFVRVNPSSSVNRTIVELKF